MENSGIVLILMCLLVNACTPKLAQDLQTEPEPSVLPEEPPSYPPPPVEPEEPSLVEEPRLIMHLQKKECYGDCPVYEIKVFDDGVAEYSGQANVRQIGTYKAVLTKETIVNFLIQAEGIRYFELEDQYPAADAPVMSDFPETVFYLRSEGREKMIRYRHDTPTELIRLIRYFDSLFEQLPWEPLK